AVLHRLDGGARSVDSVGQHVGAVLLLDGGDGTEGRVLPAAPDGEVAAAGGVRRQPRVRVAGAVLQEARDVHLVLRDLHVGGLFGHHLVEQGFAVTAYLSCAIGQRENGALTVD